MTEGTPIERLVAIAAKLAKRYRQAENFQNLLEPLRQGSLEPVEGETAILQEMYSHLDTVSQLISGVRTQLELAVLDDLESRLDSDTWEVADELCSELVEKRRRQEDLVREVDPSLKSMETRLDGLTKLVDSARLGGAPFLNLEQGLAAVRSKVSTVRRALTDRIYGDLRDRHAAALEEIDKFENLVNDHSDQIERVKKLVKQADLLIMQAGLSKGRFEYRVLLRSADRFQTRGINIIQDVVKLDERDRNWMLQRLGGVTESVNDGYRAAYAKNAASSGSSGTARGGARSYSPSSQLAMLGEFMFRMVIPERVREYLEQEQWSFTITTNDLELPWELICLGRSGSNNATESATHLCLKRSISRMPLGQVFPPPASRSTRTGQERRMLLIHSDPDGSLTEAKSEVDLLQQELGGQLKITRVDPEEATNANVNDILLSESFDFLHYAGHAYFNVESPIESGLSLKDTTLTADKIQRLNRGGSLVFLNACESGTVAKATQAQQVSYLLHKPEPVVGLASAFVYTGALGCVGSIWPVYDQPAAELAVKFYRNVLSGEPTGEALRKARSEIREEYPDEITWAAYVLYGDPTFRLTET